MPTLQEQLAVATAKLDSLLPVEQPKTVELSPSDAMAKVVDELKKGALTQERALYLSDVLSEIAKVNSEGTNTSIKIKEVNDPDQIKPETAPIATLQTLTTGKPDSQFATNLHQVIGKAQLIQKLLLDRVALRKGKLSDKLEEIVKLFGLSDDDMTSECELRWTIGDLVGQLQSAVRLERLVDGDVAKSEAPTPAAAGAPTVWPADMARAEFDPVTKAYKKNTPTWGHDDHASRR